MQTAPCPVLRRSLAEEMSRIPIISKAKRASVIRTFPILLCLAIYTNYLWDRVRSSRNTAGPSAELWGAGRSAVFSGTKAGSRLHLSVGRECLGLAVPFDLTAFPASHFSVLRPALSMLGKYS